MDYTAVSKDEMLVMGIEIKTTNEDNRAAEEIPKAWDHFYSNNILEQIPNIKSEDIFGVYCEYQGDHTKPYTLLIGCEVTEVSEVPPGLVVKKVPKSNYAKFKVEGKFPDKLQQTWQEIWKMDLPRRYSGDIEIYGKGFFQDPPEIDILISIDG